MYALKSLAAFNGADFFSLFDKDQQTLGTEMLDREEFQLMPGEQRQVQKQFPPDIRYVGVIAGFRDLEHAQWRASVAVPPQGTSRVQVGLDRDRIEISVAK
jgi:type VI secretion system protein VasD